MPSCTTSTCTLVMTAAKPSGSYPLPSSHRLPTSPPSMTTFMQDNSPSLMTSDIGQTLALTKIHNLHWYGNHLVVVGNLPLKRGVISLYHNSPTVSHPGIIKTTQLINNGCWWLGMKNTITNYIKGCAICQSRKNNSTNPKPPLFPIPSNEDALPFTSIALDFIIKLPQLNSYDTILTITDTFSKALIFIPCNETIDTEQTTTLYATYVLPHYGLPS